MRYPCIRLSLLILPTMFVGCNGVNDGRHAIKGRVLFQGKPLDQGLIEFHPVNGPPGPAAGSMIKNGRFTIPHDQGLTDGLYKVVIRSAKPVALYTLPPTASAKERERIADQYNNHTVLMVQVTPGSGTCSFDFEVD